MTTFQPHYPAHPSSAAADSNRSQRKERQTRLQEHLRSVKPGSRSSSPSNGSFKQSITPAGSASMGKTARKSVPSAAATKKGSAPATDAASEAPAPELSASGRPKRRAAKSRIVLADLESSGAEEENDDQADQEDDQDGAEQIQAAEPEEPEPRRTATSTRRRGGSKARSQPRQAIPLAADESNEDLAPSPSPKSRTSVGRKSPAKQVQSSQRRKREASNGSTGSRSAQSSPYRVDPAAMQKRQFRSVLAQHGFNPEEEVLDRALHTMSSTNQALTVDSFLRVLGTLDANASPLKRGSMGSAPQLSVSVATAPSATSKLFGFAALESPSTPSSAIDPRFLPSPPLTQSPAPRSQAGPYSYSATYSQSFAPMMVPAESLPVPSSAFALNGPLPARPPFFSNRSASTPNVPTLEAAMLASNPTPTADGSPSPRQQPQPGASAGGLFATSVAGMGRVALSRRSMFGPPGSAPAAPANLPRAAESSPTRASFHQMSPPPRSSPGPLLSPVAATANGNNGLLPAFALGAAGAPLQNAARSRASSLSKSASPIKPADDARLAKLRSWLDEDDETTEEEEVKAEKQPSGEAEASLKASAATSKLVSSLAALGTIGDVFDSQPVPNPQISALKQESTPGDLVGNPALRQSQKRQLEPTAEEVEAASKMTTRASARASTADKGKGKAVNDCFCGEAADGQPRTVECSACETPYHLACLAVSSARQLPTPFVCARCELPAAVQEPEPELEREPLATGQRTPELANKRVRIGTTSTPLLLSEPTFVASTPLSAPRGDAFGPLVADLALAPSPTASPVRRFATTRTPTSPPTQSHAQLPIPMTPSFGDATIRGPGDYSPTSPQNTRARAARTRLVSNTGAAFLGGNGGSEWLEPWDAQPFASADSMQAQASSSALSSLTEDDWRMPSWSDVNMTPSRALTRDTPATSASSSVWDTPFAHSSPQSRHRAVNFAHMRTPSQDLLAMLDREQAGNAVAQSEPAHHTFSQRLFGGSPHSAQDAHLYDNSSHHLSMPLGHPASPLNPRRYSALGHARKSSLGDGLGRAPFGSPASPAHAHAYLPAHMHGLGSVGMKPSFSAPGGRLVDLMPSMGDFDEPQHLDDLLL